MPANLVYQDGTYSTAFAVSLPVFECPFAAEGLNERLLLRQNWCQFLADFTPLAINTPHPDYPTYLLAEEGPHEDLGGGVILWQRTYAKVPESFTRPAGNYTYTFPGLYSDLTSVGTAGIDFFRYTGREPLTKSVPSWVTRDFATSAAALPVIESTKFYFYNVGVIQVELKAVFLDDGPPSGLSLVPTIPTRTEYEAWIATDSTYPDSASIVAESRAAQIWVGGIYVRETVKLKAQ